MARIDWKKVAEDYKNSSFDRERLNRYAQKAAEALNSQKVAFDGYTDESRPKEGIFGRLRQTLFASPADQARLDRQHMGYWVLEDSQEERHNGYRYKEAFMNKNNNYIEKRTHNFTGSVTVRDRKWVLLADGSLAVFTCTDQHKEHWYESGPYSLEGLKDVGCDWFSWKVNGMKLSEQQITNEWKHMTEEELLLLDHKKREVRKRYIKRDQYVVEDSTCIRADHYLLTGKKGGGCSKKITALLKKYNL